MPIKSQIHNDKALQNVAVHHRNSKYIGLDVFPKVSVTQTSGKYFEFERDFRIPDTIKAGASEAREYDWNQTLTSFYMDRHALKSFIDDEQADNYDLGDMRAKAVEKLMDKIMLRIEYEVASLFDDSAIASAAYSQGVSLSAALQFSKDTTASNPIPIFDTGALTVLGSAGVETNFKIVPKEVLLPIKNHVSVIDRIKYTGQEIDEGIVSALLGSGEMYVPTARKDTSAEGVSASISPVWTDNCFIGYKPASPSVQEPSCGYTFTKRDVNVKRWRENDPEGEWIKVEYAAKPKIVASLAGYLIVDAIA